MFPALGDRFEVAEYWRPIASGARPLATGTRFTVVGGHLDFLGDGAWDRTVIELEDGTTREILPPPHDPVLKVRPLAGGEADAGN